jgi:leucyl aminopeptidase
MNISVKDLREKDCACDALILPVTEIGTKQYDYLGRLVEQAIKKAFSKKFSGKKNELFLVPAPDGLKAEWILLAGLGKKDEVTAEGLRQAGGRSSAYLRDNGMRKAALSSKVISSFKLSPSLFAEGALLSLYTYSRYKKEKNGKTLDSLVVLSKPSKALKQELDWADTMASAVSFAKDLINTPSNDMTPSHLAKAALSLRKGKLSVRILERRDAQRLGLGAYLAVAKGSHEPPKFIVLHYKGGSKAPLVLVGKAITFDSGGISLKPAEGMEKMKYDMAGGAAVLGVMKAVSEAALPINLIGVLPATENLPGGSATKPGDVVRAVGGTTVEIINTDAEGRLVVADAIGYAKRFKPRAVVDIATLTGACSVALGSEVIAMMGNDRGLLDTLKRCGDMVYERVWEMPLFEEYKEYVKSDIADLKNTGGRTGSLVTSAYFLKEFAGEMPWVHLDIAGTAWVERERPYIPKGVSGVGVRLLLQFVRELA